MRKKIAMTAMMLVMIIMTSEKEVQQIIAYSSSGRVVSSSVNE